MIENKKVGVISLGCDKNRIDTEKMLFILQKRHTLTNNIENADIIIINTCAFLESSRKESIGEIISAIESKNNHENQKLIVTGCLPQKFVNDIKDELPEVDGFMGVSDYNNILEVIDRIYQGERVVAVGKPRGECGTSRVLTTDGHAYIKIADGCSNHCTYCLIPFIRGKFRSVPFDDIIKEAENLGKVNELILVAQNTAMYGSDLTPERTLSQLIEELSKLENIHSIRILYCYPENITDELIEEFKTNPKLIKYIDMPLQHADDRILKLMNRKGTYKGYLDLIKRLKKEIPDIALRSTFIAGFPTEDEDAFKNLVNFLREAKLFNAGFFKYSREEGTPAYKLSGQIDSRTKERRVRKLYSVQKQVVKEIGKSFINKTISVLCEGFDESRFMYYGRAYFNAPDIDGKIYFISDREVNNGEYINVKIIKATGYDLYGERI